MGVSIEYNSSMALTYLRRKCILNSQEWKSVQPDGSVFGISISKANLTLLFRHHSILIDNKGSL